MDCASWLQETAKIPYVRLATPKTIRADEDGTPRHGRRAAAETLIYSQVYPCLSGQVNGAVGLNTAYPAGEPLPCAEAQELAIIINTLRRIYLTRPFRAKPVIVSNAHVASVTRGTAFGAPTASCTDRGLQFF